MSNRGRSGNWQHSGGALQQPGERDLAADGILDRVFDAVLWSNPRARSSCPSVRRSGTESSQTCMGLFLSRNLLLVFAGSLLGAERPFFVPSPAIRFPGARGRCQGTEMLSAA